MKSRKKREVKAKPVDPELDAWVRLGGSAPESDLEGMTEGQRRIAEGNATARGFLWEAGSALSRKDRALLGSIAVPRFGS